VKLEYIKKNFWLFGIFSGFYSSLLVTLFVTISELIENPGGIFYGQGSINWLFVYDTALSWFIPTFAYMALAFAIGHLLFSFIKRLQ